MARAVTLRSGLHRTLRWMFAPIQHIAGRAKRTRRMRQPTCESRQTAALMADVRSPEQKRGPASDASPDRQESINKSPERTPFRHLSSGANRDRVYSGLLPRWASMDAMRRFRDLMPATLHGTDDRPPAQRFHTAYLRAYEEGVLQYRIEQASFRRRGLPAWLEWFRDNFLRLVQSALCVLPKFRDQPVWRRRRSLTC
jgi:hypothetical protein